MESIIKSILFGKKCTGVSIFDWCLPRVLDHAVVQGVQIIVVSHGTSQFFTAFAPRFTVVVSILPPNFLQGGWKLFQFYASLRSVEFFTRYKRYGRFIQQSHAGKEPFQRRFHDKALLPCLFHADCTFYWENNYDVRVHPGDRPFSAD